MATKAVTLKNSNDDTVYPVTDISLVNGGIFADTIAPVEAGEQIETAMIADGAVTEAKIDSAFVDKLFYKPGDTITAAVSGNYDGAQIMYNGFLTSGNTNCVMTIPVQKRLDNITSATVNYLYGYARCHGGYLTNMNSNQNIVAQSTSVVATIHPETNSITVCFTRSSGWGATNNATVSLGATSVSITLS